MHINADSILGVKTVTTTWAGSGAESGSRRLYAQLSNDERLEVLFRMASSLLGAARRHDFFFPIRQIFPGGIDYSDSSKRAQVIEGLRILSGMREREAFDRVGRIVLLSERRLRAISTVCGLGAFAVLLFMPASNPEARQVVGAVLSAAALTLASLWFFHSRYGRRATDPVPIEIAVFAQRLLQELRVERAW
ncbi:MAG TPA: hypothetical protein VN706_21565 [Gemmatimonadaceae bacterium]|nr:hypothetical protein [Gemmatimonadaceae bacterium]